MQQPPLTFNSTKQHMLPVQDVDTGPGDAGPVQLPPGEQVMTQHVVLPPNVLQMLQEHTAFLHHQGKLTCHRCILTTMPAQQRLCCSCKILLPMGNVFVHCVTAWHRNHLSCTQLLYSANVSLRSGAIARAGYTWPVTSMCLDISPVYKHISLSPGVLEFQSPLWDGRFCENLDIWGHKELLTSLKIAFTPFCCPLHRATEGQQSGDFPPGDCPC